MNRPVFVQQYEAMMFQQFSALPAEKKDRASQLFTQLKESAQSLQAFERNVAFFESEKEGIARRWLGSTSNVHCQKKSSENSSNLKRARLNAKHELARFDSIIGKLEVIFGNV